MCLFCVLGTLQSTVIKPKAAQQGCTLHQHKVMHVFMYVHSHISCNVPGCYLFLVAEIENTCKTLQLADFSLPLLDVIQIF